MRRRQMIRIRLRCGQEEADPGLISLKSHRKFDMLTTRRKSFVIFKGKTERAVIFNHLRKMLDFCVEKQTSW